MSAAADGAALELTILGSGSAFSLVGHHAAYLVDSELLLDCGAPVVRMLAERGRSLEELRYVVLSHLHGDHFFALSTLIAARAGQHPQAEPLRVLGPSGTIRALEQLGDLAVGSAFWAQILERQGPRVEEVVPGQRVELGPFQLEAVEMVHSPALQCLGYSLEREGNRLGYSGDTELCPGIRRLAREVDYLLCECTGMNGPEPIHLWREDVEQLMAEAPRTQFILTHLSERRPVKGAVLAVDGLTLRLPRGGWGGTAPVPPDPSPPSPPGP
ncbi:MAG: MBL fold metallo-hydrolase [Candidatus Dormibacteria bacterium]